MRNVIMSDADERYDASDLSGGAPQDDDASTAEVTTTQVTPAGDESPASEQAVTPADEVAENVPVQQTMRARAAVFEAIVDEYVEDSIENPPPGEEPPTREEATQEVSEIVDNAVENGTVAPNFRTRIPAIINRHYGRKALRASLYLKAAKFVTATMTEVTEEAITTDPVVTDADLINKGDETITQYTKNLDSGELDYIEEQAKTASGPGMFIPGMGRGSMFSSPIFEDDVITEEQVAPDMAPGDVEFPHISDTVLEPTEETPTSEGEPSMRARRRKMVKRSRWSMNDDVADEGTANEAEAAPAQEETGESVPANIEQGVVDPETDVQVSDMGNDNVETVMRIAGASYLTSQKFLASVSRSYTSSLVRSVGHEVRHIFPARFARRYGLK